LRVAGLVILVCLVVSPFTGSPAPALVPDQFSIVARITGFVGAKPEGVKSLARWVLAVGGTQFDFHVTKLEPIGVDIAYWTILNRLEPLPVTATLYGDAELVRQFTSAPPGTAILVTGNLELGPGPVTWLLTKVEALPPPAPTP
jgi:hypothetical protein